MLTLLLRKQETLSRALENNPNKSYKLLHSVRFMELILLPGNSVSNKRWIEELDKSLKDVFTSTTIVYWEHWKSGNGIIDLNKELNKVAKTLESKKDYVILGKSAGVVLAIKGITDRRIEPSKCIFLGTPIHWADEVLNCPLEERLIGFSTPSLFVQKEKDPLYGAKELKALLKDSGVRRMKFVSLPGEEHEYTEISKIKELVKEFVSS